jgi:hypothetical protein
MSYTPPTDKQVELMRAHTRYEKWYRLASFAMTAKGRSWCDRKALQALAEIKRLQEELS